MYFGDFSIKSLDVNLMLKMKMTEILHKFLSNDSILVFYARKNTFSKIHHVTLFQLRMNFLDFSPDQKNE